MLRQHGPRAFLAQLLRPREWWERAKAPVVLDDVDANYRAWRAGQQPPDVTALRAECETWAYRPLISIVMPVYNPLESDFRAAIESVRGQAYDRWQLCLADDASPEPHVARMLAGLDADPRFRVVRRDSQGGISAASNSALAVAEGEWIALMDHDDLLEPDALLEAVRAMNEQSGVDFIYSDEDKVDPAGQRLQPALKPDWSPALLLSMNYITHFALMRRSLLEQVGGFRSEFDGSQDYDLFLRATEHARNIVHIPRVLYSWRITPKSAAGSTTAKPWAWTAGRRAIEDALKRRGVEATVESGITPGRYRVRYGIGGRPSVSVVIPTRDRVALLRRAVASVEKASSANKEIVIVDNGSVEPETLAYLETCGHRVHRDSGDFNFSRLVNAGVKASTGEYVLLLNNDTEGRDDGWIEAMLEQAQVPDVGAVGARLFYPNGRVQHEGVAVGAAGVFALHLDWRGYLAFGEVVRDVVAVTAACSMSSRAAWERVGGFDEGFAIAYNDIDYCLRLREAGFRVVYTPYARLTHIEGASRGHGHPGADDEAAKRRWGERRAIYDPFYNKLLDSVVRPFHE